NRASDCFILPPRILGTTGESLRLGAVTVTPLSYFGLFLKNNASAWAGDDRLAWRDRPDRRRRRLPRGLVGCDLALPRSRRARACDALDVHRGAHSGVDCRGGVQSAPGGEDRARGVLGLAHAAVPADEGDGRWR